MAAVMLAVVRSVESPSMAIVAPCTYTPVACTSIVVPHQATSPHWKIPFARSTAVQGTFIGRPRLIGFRIPARSAVPP